MAIIDDGPVLFALLPGMEVPTPVRLPLLDPADPYYAELPLGRVAADGSIEVLRGQFDIDNLEFLTPLEGEAPFGVFGNAHSRHPATCIEVGDSVYADHRHTTSIEWVPRLITPILDSTEAGGNTIAALRKAVASAAERLVAELDALIADGFGISEFHDGDVELTKAGVVPPELVVSRDQYLPSL